MKWFNKWFAKKCQQAWEESRNQPDELASTMKVGRVTRADDTESDIGIFSDSAARRRGGTLNRCGLRTQVRGEHGHRATVFCKN